MSSLMMGVSGVRGIVGEALTPELLTRLGAAFGTYLESGRVLVGRDTRVSGEMIKHSVFGGLLSAGCSIYDIGVCTTPTATLMIEDLKVDGGIVITASHNPIEWNALKFFRSDGIYLNEDEMRMLFDIYYQGDFTTARWDGFKTVESISNAEEVHIGKVLDILDVETIRDAKFRAAVDCCNGAGVNVTAKFLEKLGVEIDPIHCVPNGLFPHDPEPTFLNLQDLCEHVQDGIVDVGFAQDPDADRLAIVAEDGRFIGEEYTLPLAVDYVLQERKGPVVVNISTTRAMDEIAAKHGCELVRVPVGEVNVAERMKEIGSPIGGEGNGGVIDPRVHYGRDSLVAMGLVLEMMAKSALAISELVSKLPKYYCVKIKIDLNRIRAKSALAKLGGETDGGEVDSTDGLKILWADSWVHLRSSNTEPVMRIIAEAPEESRARELAEIYRAKVMKLSKLE